jgi:alkylation response protein AidB-like acyl-CoA dehydrogenase
MQKLKQVAQLQRSHGRPLIEDQRFRDRIAQIEIDLMALEITNMRVMALDERRGAPGFEASLLKIKGSEIQQALTETLMQALGHDALPFQPEAAQGGRADGFVGPEYGLNFTGHYLSFRKATIYAGSNEIQRNIIARQLLGL